MSKVFILNGHQPYAFSPGRLNATLVERAQALLGGAGHELRFTQTADVAGAPALDVDAEIDKHRWADLILLQFPVNWMGAPWSFKRYMDRVYSAGMDGRLCAGDGRSREQPKANYGRGGSLKGTRYMLSVTFNAPREAFDDEAEFFGGRSMDDLLWPMHLNLDFFGATPLPTFACFDVMKNPEIESDLARFDDHLRAHIGDNLPI